MKWWVLASSAYLALFFYYAWSAMAPAPPAARSMWDGAKVSGHVASHTRILPLLQGRTVAPSGLFPFDLQTPTGFRWAEILAELSHHLFRSLMANGEGGDSVCLFICNNSHTIKADICMSPNEMVSCDFYSLVIFFYLFTRLSYLANLLLNDVVSQNLALTKN